MMPNVPKNNITSTNAPSLEREPSRRLTATYNYLENAKFSMYTDQKTETETDASASLYRGSESEFNIFCNLEDEWCDDDEDADEQVIPRIISASVIKTKEPVGLTISCSSDARYTSLPVVVSSVSPRSPFHPDNFSHGETIREGDEILTINGHRVKDARRAAEMIRATDEGILTVIASTAAPASGHLNEEGGKRGVRRRMDGTAYHMVRLSTYVTEGGSRASMQGCSYLGMELEVIDQSSSFVTIKSIEPSSVFARSGLKTRDVLLTIDGSIVRTVDEAIRALRDDHGTDSIDRVVILLVFSVWDMRTRVIRDELSGTSPNDWDISLSCEDKQGHVEGQKECIILTMSDTTVSFELMFDQDGSCSCPEPLAALNSSPHHQELNSSDDLSLRTESVSISNAEARAALELLFHRHILRVVDALNYHLWRQARLLSRAIDAFGGNRIDKIRVRSTLSARDSLQKSFPVALSLSAATTSTRSLTSSCPSITYPKSKSLLILSDLDRAMATQPQVPTFSLYNMKEPLSHEKLGASQHVLHSMTNLSRGFVPQNLVQFEPSKLPSNSRYGVEEPQQEPRGLERLMISEVQNELPNEIVMAVKRPKFIPPRNTDDSSGSTSTSEDSSDSSSSDESPLPRRSRRDAQIKKREVAPMGNRIVLSKSQQPIQKPSEKSRLKNRNQHLDPKTAVSSVPSLDIRKGRIQSIYKVNPKVVGLGAFGAVRYCTHRETRKEFAVKSIPKNTDAKYAALLDNEISILQRIRHKNVIRLVDLTQDDKYIHIVMEKCQGGDLFDKVIKDGVVFGEKMVSQIIASILDAVDYLHERNICHRDLKAEHIMLKTSDIKTSIKIIDFGLAVVHKPGDPPLTAFAGSAFTVAPEVIQRQYGKEVDLWSIGVIAYFLLTRLMPFNANSNNEIFKKIQLGIFAYPKWAKTGVSEEAKDFIDRLLVVNPKKRMTAKQALSHVWIRKFHHLNNSNTDMSLAVVPFESNMVISGPQVQRKCEDRQQSSELTRALVSYGDKKAKQRSTKLCPQTKLLDPICVQVASRTLSQPSHQDQIGRNSRRLHLGKSHEDRDRSRSKRHTTRKPHKKQESKQWHHSSGIAYHGMRETLEPQLSRLKPSSLRH